MIQLRARGLDIDGNGRRALIILLMVYITGFAVVGLGPISAPPASCLGSPQYPLGNITVVTKPVDIVRINKGQIPVGETWTYTYRLKANLTYHIYLLGDWADPAEHRTDYDIIVYEISGRVLKFVSSHTESAGLPEQVGNDGYGRYFRPSRTGTYYISVVNDPLESSAAEAGTLMVIEHIEANRWHSRYMRGKADEKPVKETTWAYEFNTSADRIRVYVDIPGSLDMYEARLYVMANPAAKVGGLLNGIPVAWGPGLRGEQNGIYGGFNFDPQGFRHIDAMASCEHSGEDMVIDYAPTVGGDLLYHLVLIAEYFSGTVEFIIQTDLEPPTLELIDPPDIVESGEPTSLEVSVRDGTAVESVSLGFSIDGGVVWKQLDVSEQADGIYGGVIPAFGGGTVVDYVFEAEDEIGNGGEVRGSFTVMSSPSLELHLGEDEIKGGESITANGHLDEGGKEVEIIYQRGDAVSNFMVTTADSGHFNHIFTPDKTGDWQVSAHFAGDNDSLPASSEALSFAVSSRSASLTCTLSDEEIELGREVTISGVFSLEMAGLIVELTATSGNATRLYATTSADGSYNTTFKPDAKGTWEIRARVQGDGFRYEGAESPVAELAAIAPRLKTRILRLPSFLVRPPYLYGVLGGVGGMVGVTIFFFMRRE